MKNLSILLLLALLVAWSCQPKKSGESETKTDSEIVEVAPSLTKIWESDKTVLTPESVIFNPTDSLLYVSCINGVPPNAKDGDGFIAKMSPKDGSIVDLKWIEGIDAPKGMGIYEGKLYVTNIDEIVEIDIASASITNRYAVEAANFLNDIDISDSGDVYISDSGTNKLHLLKDGKVSAILEKEEFGRPNGVLFLGQQLMLSTSGSGNFYSINTEDWSYEVLTDSIMGGDGVVSSDEDFVVSSWNGEVYYVTAEGEKTLMLDTKGKANSADIEIVDGTVYVPTFFGNQVVAYRLDK